MQEFVESGRIVDAILAIIVAQVAVLHVLRVHRGIGPGALAPLPSLAAGAALLLALRGALTGGSWLAILAWLTLAFAAHLIDLHRRWPRR